MKRNFFIGFFLLAVLAWVINAQPNSGPFPVGGGGSKNPTGNGAGLTNLNPANLTAGGLVPSSAVYTVDLSLNTNFGFGVGYSFTCTNGTTYLITVNNGGNGNGLWDTNGNQLSGNGNPSTYTATSNGPAILVSTVASLGDPVQQQIKVVVADATPVTFPTDVFIDNLFVQNLNVNNLNATGIPTLSASQTWTGVNTFDGLSIFYTNSDFINTNQYTFVGKVSAASGTNLFTAAQGSFLSPSILMAGNIVNCTNGDGSTSQYKILKVIDSTHMLMDFGANNGGAPIAYSSITNVVIYPNTADYSDNVQQQGFIGRDGSMGNWGIGQDSDANSGAYYWLSGTNSVWANQYFDSVDNWFGFQTGKLRRNISVWRFHLQAPADAIKTLATGVSAFKGVGSYATNWGTGVLTFTALGFTNTLTNSVYGHINVTNATAFTNFDCAGVAWETNTGPVTNFFFEVGPGGYVRAAAAAIDIAKTSIHAR